MKPDWLITNTDLTETPEKNIKSELFTVYYNAEVQIVKIDDVIVLIDGYVLPRFDFKDVFSERKNGELVVYLYKKYGEEFIQYLKGSFNLILIVKGKLKLFNDHIGLKKFFIFEQTSEFIISNDINFIAKNQEMQIDETGIAVNTLFHHFTGGVTLYENVRTSPNASEITVTNSVASGVYWSYRELANLERTNLSFDNFADKITHITKGYLDYIGSDKISMTLTGGMDSRTILAMLLKLGYKPNTFTFGSGVSADVEVAKKITKSFDLKFNNYAVPNPDGEWYDSLTDEIVEMGNPLIHIHRAHRLDAIKKELEENPDVKILFTGAMGGEGIRGLHYDNLIVTNFVKRLHHGENCSVMNEVLEKYFVKTESLSSDDVKKVIDELSYFSDNRKLNEFFVLYELVASLHDYQDLTIYQNKLPYVISIFLDIDYLEMLFSSQHSLFNKDNLAGNQLKRLNIPEVHCNLIDRIYKPLSKIKFVNGFSPREFLTNKYYYLFLRAVRKKFGKKYPPNFPYGEWYHSFIAENFNKLDSSLEDVIDVNRAKDQFVAGNHKTVEGYWHKFTNIVMYSKHITNAKRK
ncbi:MAG: hypothetical protein SCALA702_33720 [Melioribacteraceae bacterium]|nr:MAG: hypothetical protein SCALA702_33720 [Melioribacteraceae bacterium]